MSSPHSKIPYSQYRPYPSTIDDIKSVIRRSLTSHSHLEIVWVGLTGSFSKSIQTINDDIDLVIGYAAPEHEPPTWDVSSLTREFEFLCGRTFDLTYVCDEEMPLSDKAVGAFLSAQTVFQREGGEQWYRRNRELVRATKERRGMLRREGERSKYEEFVMMLEYQRQMQQAEAEMRNSYDH